MTSRKSRAACKGDFPDPFIYPSTHLISDDCSSCLLVNGRASEEGQKKLQSMEEAFTKLKQITGVQNVGDMHEKFSNQKSNKLQLEAEVWYRWPSLLLLIHEEEEVADCLLLMSPSAVR